MPPASDREGDKGSETEPDKVLRGELYPINGGGMVKLFKTNRIRGSVVRGCSLNDLDPKWLGC